MPACDVCYKRKVRCDADFVQGSKCSACINSGVDCTFQTAEQHRVRRRTRLPRSQRSLSSRSMTQTTPRTPRMTSASLDLTENPTTTDLPSPDLFHKPRNSHSQLLIPTNADIAEQGLARTALTRFYHHSINSSAWSVFNDTAQRVSYVGKPISNLAQLVDDEAEFSGSRSTSLHLPSPSIRPRLPWKPPRNLPLVRWYSTSFADDISALPAKDVRDDLIASYFSKVHPGFPIVDEAHFRAQYADDDNQPPLLLLQAVLLVGAHVSTHEKVVQSRPLVKMALFRRAKALFDLHYENNRMNVVQAALLFTWHFEGADDVSSNVYYWVGVACRVAFGLGMNRDLSPTAANRMPLYDRRIFRKVWWTLLQVDVLASLHHGRPPMIDPDECDQPPLTNDDFVEPYQDMGPEREVSKNIDIDFCIQNSSLCSIILSIMKLSSPGSVRRHNLILGSYQASQSQLESQLAGWYLKLPETLSDFTRQNSKFLALKLQLHYNLALLHLHRVPKSITYSAEGIQEGSSRETCHTAALSIAQTLSIIVSSSYTSQCWFTCMTALLAAAIQISHEARAAARVGAAVLAIQAQNRLERLLPVMSAISKFWTSAEAILNLYTDLLKQLKKQTQTSFDFGKVVLSPASNTSPLNLNDQQINGGILNQGYSGLEDNHSLGSIGILGGDWEALFGAGQFETFPDMSLPGMQDWQQYAVDDTHALFGEGNHMT